MFDKCNDRSCACACDDVAGDSVARAVDPDFLPPTSVDRQLKEKEIHTSQFWPIAHYNRVFKVQNRHHRRLSQAYVAMAHSTLTDLFAFTLGPSGWAVLLVTLIVISIPVSLHLYWFNSRSSTTLPSFLLTGPSGAGKTSLLTLVRSLFKALDGFSCMLGTDTSYIVRNRYTVPNTDLANPVERRMLPSRHNSSRFESVSLSERSWS